eukprot:6477347-Prymnesium_polylepis.1
MQRWTARVPLVKMTIVRHRLRCSHALLRTGKAIGLAAHFPFATPALLAGGTAGKFEFGYALLRKGVQRMVAVVMEPEMRDTKQWVGVVGGKLGLSLYVDLSADEDDEHFTSGVERLAREIRGRMEESSTARWLKAAVHA